jgi:hypothetical protein
MKTLRQLDNKYKEALQEYEVAPREEQWQRFQIALEHAQKRKKRRFFFMISCMLLTLGIIASVIFMKVESVNPAVKEAEIFTSKDIKGAYKNPKAAQEAPHSEVAAAKSEIVDVNSRATAAKSETSGGLENRSTGGAKQNSAPKKGSEFKPAETGSPKSPESSGIVVGSPEINKGATADVNPGPRLGYSGNIFGADLSGIRMKPWFAANVLAGLKLIFSSAAYKPKDNDKTRGNDEIPTGLFFAFSGGPGFVNNTFRKVDNPDKQHKDVEKIFNAMNGRYRSTVIQAGLVYVPKNGHRYSVSGGFQFREIIKTVDFRYLYTQIPFKDTDGKILAYINDSIGKPFFYNGVNRMRFLSVPLYFRTPLWTAGKSEIALGAGVQFQGLFVAKGQYFDVNTISMNNLSIASYRRWNMGYMFGASYSQWFNDRVGLFAEVQGTFMRQNMQHDSSQIKTVYSRMTGVNTQVGLRIKLNKK